MDQAFRKLEASARQTLASINDRAGLESWRQRWLGRKGELTKLLNQLSRLPASERPRLGQLANGIKNHLHDLASQRAQGLNRPMERVASLSATLPGRRPRSGHLHPLTLITRRLVEIFRSMGFETVTGPEVESAELNFDQLNIPPDHPARDLCDTFYIKSAKPLVLRTHTSPVQLRALQTRRPPVRLIAPGRVFRHEATDASHEATLTQLEGLVIDEDVRLTDLFGTVNDFLSALFERPITTKHRPSFFPFVEPGGEIVMGCTICGGRGCSVCGLTGFLEMGGQGMVHPTVLKNMGLDSRKYSGFAFGFGIERLMMLYYRIPDIRLTLSGDLRFSQQF